MRPRTAWLIVAGVSVVAMAVTGTVGVIAWAGYEQRMRTASDAVIAPPTVDWLAEERIVFRNTAPGAGYGLVAAVPLDHPQGARTMSSTSCDRVDATASTFACLQTVRGLVPTFVGSLRDAHGAVLSEWPLAGVPSRTRLSANGALLATTSFVSGHSYATVGFSTETVIHTADGADHGNLEEWTLLIDGSPSAAVDRNFWGVTFVDNAQFYATVGLTTTGTTYLVRGDIAARTLESIAENVECPSLSPDGSRLAFKRVTAGAGPTAHWTPAIYDLRDDTVTVLPESRSIDDQIEWLDDETLLYGMPRLDAAGETDVWALSADGTSEPQVFIEHAWSPSVVPHGAGG